MKRKQDEDLDILSDLYRSNPNPSRDVDWDAYERKVKEQDEKFGKFDEIGNSNKHRNKPVDASILEWKADIQQIEDRYKGKPTKSWDRETLDLDY